MEVAGVYRYGTRHRCRPHVRSTPAVRISGGWADVRRVASAHGKMMRWQAVCRSTDLGNSQVGVETAGRSAQ